MVSAETLELGALADPAVVRQSNLMKSSLIEAIKFAVYRTPIAGSSMAPRYRYKINPGQLAAMIGFIDATRGTNAAIVEVGVAQGDSSVFIMEHLRTSGDPRPLVLLDTFSGFTAQNVAYEVDARGKAPGDFAGRFSYTDDTILKRNLRRAGYQNFRTIRADATTFNWSSLGPIGAMLLDVDLYQPTASTIAAAVPSLIPGGGIVLDDCVDGTPDDGASQAYAEYLAESGRPFERVGAKGGIIRGDQPSTFTERSKLSSAS